MSSKNYLNSPSISFFCSSSVGLSIVSDREKIKIANCIRAKNIPIIQKRAKLTQPRMFSTLKLKFHLTLPLKPINSNASNNADKTEIPPNKTSFRVRLCFKKH